MTSRIFSPAEAHAIGIVNNLERFAELIAEFGDDITAERLLDDAREAADNDDRDEADRLRALAEWLDDYVGDNARGNLVAEWVSASLDHWVTLHWRSDRTDVRSVTVLVSSGGPHAEVRYDGGDLLRVTVWWDGQTIERSADCPPLSAYLESVAEVAER